MLNVEKLRADFPILAREVHGKPLIYLDNAATSQKPEAVIQSLSDYYRRYNANIHRGVHTLAEEATAAYEGARRKVARFINAGSPREVVFVRNTTEAINLVALCWGRSEVREGDLIVLSLMEHHSNLVPWQLLAQAVGARLEFIGLDPEGRLLLGDLDHLLDRFAPRVKLVAVSGMSNVLGTINPVAEIGKRAHAAGALLLVDGAQSVPHLPVDVRALGADFLAFSGHKMLGPTGIGVLWARREILEAMPPFMGGGDMIKSVHLRESEWNDIPHKFEAGTPNIAHAIGLAAAVDYLSGLRMEAVRAHEQAIASYAMSRLPAVPGLHIYGPPADERGGVVTFNLLATGGAAQQPELLIHPHDLASILDREGIAIRAGHHCAQPLMEHYGVPATARASFYVYNTKDEVDRLAEGLLKAQKVFGLG